jgi:transposase
MNRYIGIVPRVKRTAQGEARPTKVCITIGADVIETELKTEQEELDFVLKAFQAGDIVAMALGGCGDNFAFALSKRAEQLGGETKVIRIPPFVLKRESSTNIALDHIYLAQFARDKPGLFTEVVVRDRKTIRVRESLRVRTDVMKARIACEQRLHQRFIGQIFCSEAGLYPQGSLEKAYDELKANDLTLSALLAEEAKAERELEKAVKDTEVFQKLFLPIEGCGYKIASRIIAVVGDIRRFETAPKLRKYLGVHVMDDGGFPRRRNGQVANWNDEARKALYLLAEQFNRRPDSDWGKYLRTCKARLRVIHPEKMKDEKGKWRYTDGHIHKMGSWRCMSRFVEWMFREWWKHEKAREADSTSTAEAVA